MHLIAVILIVSFSSISNGFIIVPQSIKTPRIRSIIFKMVQGVEIDSNNCIVNTNPATGEIISRVPCTTEDEINAMVDIAKIAFQSWRVKTYTDRISLLKQGLQSIKEDDSVYNRLVELIVFEMGKPINEAKEEMQYAVSKDEYFEILEETLQPKQYKNSVVVRNPYGVVAIMSPWNFPVDEILLLAIPSLASGNVVIVKPSEVVPETGALLVKTLQKVLPDGVLQLAQGSGTVGAALVSHPNVDMVAMTGSSQTGKTILQSAATQLKRVILEMGGKDPMIVFGDADLDKAAHDAVMYSLCNTGQVCCSVERIYVAESTYDQFQTLCKQVALEYKVGNGMDPNNKVGPLVSQMQKEQVKQHVEDAIAKGAKLLHQSDLPQETKGSFYPVTVLADVNDNMKLFTAETFGPVVAMTKFDGSEEEAIRLANKTEYGLGSSVYTQDMEKANRIAALIDAGQVGINCYPLENMDVQCPWVGHKHSGFGYHSGYEGFLQFSIPKTIVLG